jgi:hypothetical protein
MPSKMSSPPSQKRAHRVGKREQRMRVAGARAEIRYRHEHVEPNPVVRSIVFVHPDPVRVPIPRQQQLGPAERVHQ